MAFFGFRLMDFRFLPFSLVGFWHVWFSVDRFCFFAVLLGWILAFFVFGKENAAMAHHDQEAMLAQLEGSEQ